MRTLGRRGNLHSTERTTKTSALTHLRLLCGGRPQPGCVTGRAAVPLRYLERFELCPARPRCDADAQWHFQRKRVAHGIGSEPRSLC